MLTLATKLAAVDTSHSSGVHILCVLVLIAAIVGTVICLAALLGLGGGPFARNGRAGYGYLGAPVLVTIILWVVYFVVCPG